ncbi:MAG: hypothetical protein M0R33_14240 [Methylomonas sp.]|jgi:hypothetical protein|uniref:hypothetical protein n=1 Tax=Methylomonas sp. TaxID=418 RepID=UPI0025CE5D88|nr:hypothetical protein [Methylomonas sp.]MCK9607597.1 hypothetical protein [Methylomonas sp.]
MRKTIAFTYFAILLTNPLTANAVQVRMDYTGVATLATGIFGDETVTLLNGYAADGFVSGSFFIDTEFTESPTTFSTSTDHHNEYVPNDSPNLNEIWGLNVLYGLESHTTAANQRDPIRDHHRLILQDLENNAFGPDDRFYYQANSFASGDDVGGIYLDADDLISAGAPSLTGDSLSFTFLDNLAQRLMFLPEQNYQGQYNVFNSSNQEIGRLEWEITGLTATLIPVAQVPLPPSFFSFASSILLIIGFWRKPNLPSLHSVR